MELYELMQSIKQKVIELENEIYQYNEELKEHNLKVEIQLVCRSTKGDCQC